FALLSETARQRVADYLVHVATTAPDPLETAIFFLSLAPEDLRPPIVARWRHYLDNRARADDPVFGPWHDLFDLPDADFVGKAPEVLQRWKARDSGTQAGQVNPRVQAALLAASLTGKADVARAYGRLLQGVYEESKKAASPKGVDEASRQLLEVLTGRDS